MTLGREKAWGMFVVFLTMTALVSGCAEESATEESAFAPCPSDMAGTAWTPAVPGSSSANHDSAVEVITTSHTGTVPLLGLGQGANCSSTSGSCPDTTSRIVSIPFTVDEDLGVNGSISLVADPYGLPSDLVGSAWPMLVSVIDPNGREWINFPLGSGTDCAEEGFFVCDDGYCSQNAGCTTGGVSAYKDWTHWRQNNIPAFGFASTNSFPTCNWTGGTPSCHFTDGGGDFFNGTGKLPTGSYTAKFVLLASQYSKLSANYTGGIKLTVIRKKDATAPAASDNGAFDVNVIIIGTDNVESSRTAKGKANLNALFEHVNNHFADATEGTGVKIGKVTSYEVCGENYTNVDFTEVGDLLAGGSELVDSASEGKAINIFLVSSIQYDDANLTILGASGSIGGPMVNGTGSSGVVFSTFGRLESFNENCSGSTCLVNDQEEDFVEMGNTVSHELGHYLGLNHLSEMDGSRRDTLPDTPECSTTSSGGGTLVTHGSCLSGGSCQTDCAGYDGVTNFCPAATSCEFNHVMWYTVKKYNSTTGDGDAHIFSDDSSALINFNPLVQ